MKTQLRPVGVVLRCPSCSASASARIPSLGQISGPTQAPRMFTSAARISGVRPTSPLRTSCRLQLRDSSPYSARRGMARAAFSTTSLRSSPDAQEKPLDPAAADEAKDATPGPSGKPIYPERLIIYHAGTAKTTFIACLKVTTLFVFGFFDMIMTPAYLAAGQPLLQTAGVALCGLIPAAYVAWSTAPFVATVHMHLPPYARWSRAILERFARTAPPGSTRLDVTTMSLIGKPRVSSMVLADLRPASGRLGMVTHERDTAALDASRPWWRFRAVRRFGMLEGGEKQVKTGWVWTVLSEGIAKRNAAKVEAGTATGKGKL